MIIKKRMFFLCVLLIVILSVLGSFYLINHGYILKRFNILSVLNEGKNVEIIVSEVPAAKNYQLIIYDDENSKIFDQLFDSKEMNIVLDDMVYNHNYYFKVYAISADGEVRSSENEYVLLYNDASLNHDGIVLLNNEDYLIFINGDLSNKYSIKVYKNDELIKEDILVENGYLIPNTWYLNEEAIIKTDLYKGNTLVDTLTLYNNVNPISDVNILKPSDQENFNGEDILLEYTGGINAESTLLNIYNANNFLLKSINIKNHQLILNKNIFKNDGLYKIEIICSLAEYQKSSSIVFNVTNVNKAGIAYIKNNYKNIKAGSVIELITDEADSNIYYTLDGSEVTDSSNLYTEPIIVNNDVTIKTMVTKNGYVNSDIMSYDVELADSNEISIYLAPSKQYNLGIEGSLFTNENQEMMEIAKIIKNNLSGYFKVYDNSDCKTTSKCIDESNNQHNNVYIALQTDYLSTDKRGYQIWVNDKNSESYSIASKINDELGKLSNKKSINYAMGLFDEISSINKTNSMLINLGYHDDLEDANWIAANRENIANAISQAIIDYYK